MTRLIKSMALLMAALIMMSAAPGDTGNIRIFLMGDSTMADKPLDKQNPERGWGQYFPSILDSGVEVLNYAENGRSTKSFITRGIWDKVRDQLRPGDYVFIQFGHNDSKEDDPERFAAPWSDYTDNLSMFVETVQSKGAIPVLLTPIARRHFDEQGNLKNVHGDYPEAMKRVAEKYGVVLLDMTGRTNEWLTALGDEASVPYFMNIEPGTNPLHPDGKVDNTHLRPSGASKVARLVAREIEQHIPAIASHLTVYDFVVAQDGSGDFFTVQEAVNAAPDYNKNRPTTIYVRRGIYRGKLTVPANKNNLHIIGEDAPNTVITWDDYAAKIGSTGFQIGTSGTATVYIHAADFTADNITFENSAAHPQGQGHVGQAVAVGITGDRARFRGCRFIGNQDTLYTISPSSRQYYENCYIEGTTDYIFGFSTAYFKDCEIHSKRNSYITAASTPEGHPFGYVFDGCRITADEGLMKIYLGRPWRIHAKTVLLNCWLGPQILPEGWHNWSKPEAEQTSFYAEYRSTGPGANPGARVPWSHQLTDEQAEQYTVPNVLGGPDGWDPYEDKDESRDNPYIY